MNYQANTFALFPNAEWDAAEYDPSRKMNEENPRQKSKQQKASLYKNTQDYDPLLLLQSMPEIRLHAQRFYQDGLEKFLRKGKRRYKPSVLAEYKLNFVCQAQEYVKCLLKANYRKEKKARAHQIHQIAHGEENTLEPLNWEMILGLIKYVYVET